MTTHYFDEAERLCDRITTVHSRQIVAQPRSMVGSSRRPRAQKCEVGLAELGVEDGELFLRLSGVEKTEALHGDLHAPLSAIRTVEVVEDAHEMTRVNTGFKVGMRIPGRATVGVVRQAGHTMFIAVHDDTPRAVRVVLEGDTYDEWIVGANDPDEVIADLSLGS